MAYTINLTNGAIFATIPDGTRDTSSSLVIIGKNYTGYGEFIGENFVRVLENHANTLPPDNPLTGQLWYDINETTLGLNVYDGTTFKTLGTIITSVTEPAKKVTGDTWYDTSTEQLKVFNGTDYELVGPLYTSTTGKTGPVVQILLDTGSTEHVATVNYVEGNVVSIEHKDTPFTLNAGTPIAGFPGLIYPGIHLVDDVATEVPQFTGTATNSVLLNNVNSDGYLSALNNDSTAGTLGVLNDGGLAVGADSDLQISITGADAFINNSTTNGRLVFQSSPQGVTTDVITIAASGADARARVLDPLIASDIANMNYVDTEITTLNNALSADKVSRDGSLAMTGDLDFASNKIVNLGSATLGTDGLNRDTGDARYLAKDLSGTFNASGGSSLRFENDSGDSGNTSIAAALEVYQDTIGKDAFMSFHVGSDYAVQFGLDGGTNDLFVGGWSMGSNQYTVHHDGNTGQGTGLVYTASNGTKVVPGGVNRAEITLIGGGGGGASGGDGGNFGGVYGGTGGYSRVYVSNAWQYAYGGYRGRPNSHVHTWVTPTITGWGQSSPGGWRTDENFNLGGDGGGSMLGYGGKGSTTGTNAASGLYGGGGAGGWGQDGIPGNGGHSGMLWTQIFSVSPGQTITWQLGAGGGRGVWGSRNGGVGGGGLIIIRFLNT